MQEGAPDFLKSPRPGSFHTDFLQTKALRSLLRKFPHSVFLLPRRNTSIATCTSGNLRAAAIVPRWLGAAGLAHLSLDPWTATARVNTKHRRLSLHLKKSHMTNNTHFHILKCIHLSTSWPKHVILASRKFAILEPSLRFQSQRAHRKFACNADNLTENRGTNAALYLGGGGTELKRSKSKHFRDAKHVICSCIKDSCRS